MKHIFFILFTLLAGAGICQEKPLLKEDVYLIPNFHPSSCGWLTNFSTERNYCANSYFEHMAKVSEDTSYNFVISEVNNMIAMMNFQPNKFKELKKWIEEGRIEAVNAMFLELTPNLSVGEAVIRAGVNGIRWQEEMLGVRPRFNWLIDVVGMHEQLAQIGHGLGLEAQVHCRSNVCDTVFYWSESPDGTRLLTIDPSHYSNYRWIEAHKQTKDLPDSSILALGLDVQQKMVVDLVNDTIYYPEGLPFMALWGSADYSLPPPNSAEFKAQWEKYYPNSKLHISTLGNYFDEVSPLINSGEVKLPVVKHGWVYYWDGFWIENDKVHKMFRKTEHALQAGEMLAAIGSLEGKLKYPSQNLYHAWLLMHLNSDRASLWGNAGGMVFESDISWDVKDRYNWISSTIDKINTDVLGRDKGEYLTWFNAANWQRNDPQYVELESGKTLSGYTTQKAGNKTLFFPDLASVGTGSVKTIAGNPGETKKTGLNKPISTSYYDIVIDRQTGDLVELIMKKSGIRLIDKNSNILVAEQEKSKVDLYHFISPRKDRVEIASTKGSEASIEVREGKLATIITITSDLFSKGDAQRIITVYNNYPRIDFDVYLKDVPDKTLVVSEFTFAEEAVSTRRGIPNGFVEEKWPEGEKGYDMELLPPWVPDATYKVQEEGILPVIQWSDYQFANGSGLALLDRGLPGRENHNNSVCIFLKLAAEKYMGYPNPWLSGKGTHHYQYAIIGYDSQEYVNVIPRMAWEYNAPPVFMQAANAVEAKSFLSSSDNIIIHSMHREADELEIRFVESNGMNGVAELSFNLPVGQARITNFLGEGTEELKGEGYYSMPVRPQQIVTLRFMVEGRVQDTKPITDWTSFVPDHKRDFLNKYDKDVNGHPPLGE